MFTRASIGFLLSKPLEQCSEHGISATLSFNWVKSASSSQVNFRSVFFTIFVSSGWFSPKVWAKFRQWIVWLQYLISVPCMVLVVPIVTYFRFYLFFLLFASVSCPLESCFFKTLVFLHLFYSRLRYHCCSFFIWCLWFHSSLLVFWPFQAEVNNLMSARLYFGLLAGCWMNRESFVWVCTLCSSFPQVIEYRIVFCLPWRISVGHTQDSFPISILVPCNPWVFWFFSPMFDMWGLNSIQLSITDLYKRFGFFVIWGLTSLFISFSINFVGDMILVSPFDCWWISLFQLSSNFGTNYFAVCFEFYFKHWWYLAFFNW